MQLFRRERIWRRPSRGCSAILVALFMWTGITSATPPLLGDDGPFLPDFSFAGYEFGERKPTLGKARHIEATDYGVIPDDERDDSRALQKAFNAAHSVDGPVVLQLPAGRLILSDILYIERSDMVLRGAGQGATEIYFPRPLMYLPDPPALQELREYLVAQNKQQREKANNIDLPFSQYSWAGGFIWTRVPGERVKAYLDDYHQPVTTLATAEAGQRGEHWIEVEAGHTLSEGDVVNIHWHNRDGEGGPLLDAIYQTDQVTIGSHHWTQPDQPLVRQPARIEEIDANRVRIKDTLLHDISASGGHTRIVEWPHLSRVGIEHLSLTFPTAPTIAHHVEPGYNAIFLTRVFNGWVKDVRIHNADSGILTEEVANLSLENITTTGENLAHYSVSMGDTHNVLVKNLKVHNRVRHPLSFNTFATRSVYTQSQVYNAPVLDQHSGANHQNLFDDLEVLVQLDQRHLDDAQYPLFKGGGAGYWKPTHGAYNTFWNIRVQVDGGLEDSRPLRLHGVSDGPRARLIGIHGNRPLTIDYGPDALIKALNTPLRSVPSLYEYQRNQRLGEP